MFQGFRAGSGGLGLYQNSGVDSLVFSGLRGSGPWALHDDPFHSGCAGFDKFVLKYINNET